MTVFYTSDSHLFHKFVAKLRWQRAFPGISVPENIEHVIKWHNSLLAQNWDSTVGKDDVVWVLGDLSLFSTRSGVDQVLGWFAARPGRKHLVPGNHDPVHPMHSEAYKWQKNYLDEAFHSVQLAARRTFAMRDGTRRNVLLSHMPYEGDRDGPDRDTQWRLRDEGDWLLHGHLHSDEPMRPDGTRMIDVGVDAWNMTPVSQDHIIELMAEFEFAPSSVPVSV